MPYNRYRSKCNIVSNSRVENNRYLGVTDLNSKLKDGPQVTNSTGGPGLDYIQITTNFNGLTSAFMPFQYFQTNLRSNAGLSNATVWAHPGATNNFETLAGIAANGNLTTANKFDTSQFDNPGTYSIRPSAFPGLTGGCLWYAMSVWTVSSFTTSHLGTVFLNFRTIKATGSNGLSDLFAPAMFRPTEAFVVHGSGSNKDNFYTERHVDPRAGTYFSSEAAAGSNGYATSTSGGPIMSLSDGVWGYRAGSIALDGSGENGGALLPMSGTFGQKCYGIQNYNSTDSSANEIYWGDQVFYDQSSFRFLLWTVYA